MIKIIKVSAFVKEENKTYQLNIFPCSFENKTMMEEWRKEMQQKYFEILNMETRIYIEHVEIND